MAPANEDKWKVYEVLLSHLQLCHNRLVDNYRIFLTFNSILVSANTALLAFIYKGDGTGSIWFRLAVVAVCVLGIFVTRQAQCLVRRVTLDSNVRVRQITRLEKSMEGLPLSPFVEGGEFFFNKVPIPGVLKNEKKLTLKNEPPTTRAKVAYERISWAFYVAYLLLIFFSLFPLYLSLFKKEKISVIVCHFSDFTRPLTTSFVGR